VGCVDEEKVPLRVLTPSNKIALWSKNCKKKKKEKIN